jgi:F-type H+-transporting ATPase subunit delta
MKTLTTNDIARAIYLALEDKTPSKRIVEFLREKHMLGRSDEILAQLRKIINSHSGIVEAEVRTAKALSPTKKSELKKFLTKRYSAKDVAINEVVSKELLGGERIEVGDEVIDLSYKNKLFQLQEFLTRP